MRTLREKWTDFEGHWKDRVRQEFEEKYLAELQERVRSTMDAMDRLAEVIDRAERDCS
jgi:hypothetical protein